MTKTQFHSLVWLVPPGYIAHCTRVSWGNQLQTLATAAAAAACCTHVQVKKCRGEGGWLERGTTNVYLTDPAVCGRNPWPLEIGIAGCSTKTKRERMRAKESSQQAASISSCCAAIHTHTLAHTHTRGARPLLLAFTAGLACKIAFLAQTPR